MPRPSNQPVAVPGVMSETVEEPDNTDDLAALRAELAAARAQIAVLSKPSESVVTVPITRHGAQKLAESEFAALTTKQVEEMLQAGQISLNGRPSVLCADGYFCDPSYR